MEHLLQFLERLDEEEIHYFLGHYRDSINVHVTIPGQRWEVEFFAGGSIEVEVFLVDGRGIGGPERLKELFGQSKM